MVDGVSFVFAVVLNFFVYLSVALLEDEGHFLILLFIRDDEY